MSVHRHHLEDKLQELQEKRYEMEDLMKELQELKREQKRHLNQIQLHNGILFLFIMNLEPYLTNTFNRGEGAFCNWCFLRFGRCIFAGI